MLSRHSSQRPNACAESVQEPRIPLLYWLVVGGTGLPPTKANFRRMVSERKTAYREEKAYREARKAARAEFEAKWPAVGFGATVRSKKQERLDRGELIKLYGPGGTSQRQSQAEGRNDDRADGGNDGHNGNGADGDGNGDDGGNNGNNNAE
ncbi:hypothetical protein O1611_g9293 [Lasiodiplodia mahajangana]|uniref:Uncharacterized protein n=1 Tax=Lasiodiplodia mahajangana TaxID=1108764 RepID=A0ACC2JB07_9PEZI|nr:hypothetical protein O1611_g9293 [Lasiodiplodia mahajangana]